MKFELQILEGKLWSVLKWSQNPEKSSLARQFWGQAKRKFLLPLMVIQLHSALFPLCFLLPKIKRHKSYHLENYFFSKTKSLKPTNTHTKYSWVLENLISFPITKPTWCSLLFWREMPCRATSLPALHLWSQQHKELFLHYVTSQESEHTTVRGPYESQEMSTAFIF